MRRSLEAMALAFLFALAACGGGGEEADTGGEVATEEEVGPAVSPDSAATITGVVNFTGTAPAQEPIDMSEEPTCAEKHPGGATREQVVTGDGTLGNVFVYVKDGLGSRRFPTSSDAVTIDQNGCHYVPHVLAIQTGQTLVIKNSDGILHNINTQPTVNQGFNVSQPVAMETTKTFSSAEVMIPVKCDVHGWMEAFIGVQSHPYMAVTVNILHGICYTFFFATLYIFVDEFFPKDARTSAQGLFNFLILGAGQIASRIIWPTLQEFYTKDGTIQYQQLLLYPAGAAVIAAALLLLFFHPPAKPLPETVGH